MKVLYKTNWVWSSTATLSRFYIHIFSTFWNATYGRIFDQGAHNAIRRLIFVRLFLLRLRWKIFFSCSLQSETSTLSWIWAPKTELSATSSWVMGCSPTVYISFFADRNEATSKISRYFDEFDKRVHSFWLVGSILHRVLQLSLASESQRMHAKSIWLAVVTNRLAQQGGRKCLMSARGICSSAGSAFITRKPHYRELT